MVSSPTAEAHVKITSKGVVTVTNGEATLSMAQSGDIMIQSDAKIVVKQGDNTVTVSKESVEVKAKKVTISGGAASSVELSSSGATVTAPMINLNA